MEQTDEKEVRPALPVRVRPNSRETAYCIIEDANGHPIALSVAKVHAPVLVRSINAQANEPTSTNNIDRKEL